MVKTIETGKYPFVMCNFAPPDMVGHTGKYEAAVIACNATGTFYHRFCCLFTFRSFSSFSLLLFYHDLPLPPFRFLFTFQSFSSFVPFLPRSLLLFLPFVFYSLSNPSLLSLLLFTTTSCFLPLAFYSLSNPSPTLLPTLVTTTSIFLPFVFLCFT